MTDGILAPPHSREAEQAVIGGLMLVNETLPKVADWLKPEDFYGRDHRAIYQAMLDLAEQDPPQPFDVVTVGEWFESRGELELVDNGAYLIELAQTTPSAANVEAYAQIVRGKATQRQLIEVGEGLRQRGFDPAGEDLSVIVADATMALSELKSSKRVVMRTAKQVGKSWYAALLERYENPGRLLGIATPWERLNALTGGLQSDQLIIVAGRPSMGKSAVGLGMAVNAALTLKKVAMVFTLEMSGESCYNRAVASTANVPLSWLRSPDGEHEEYWTRVSSAVKDINGSGLVFDDTPGLTDHQIIARCRRERLKHDIGLVVVDHLHIMATPGKTKESSEVGDITRRLKALSKELGCPVVLLSQLNRSLESRQNKRPVMADLRESGAIEQDADVIIFVYRDRYYAEREGRVSPLGGFVELIVAKQREGETGTVWARDELAYGRVGDYDGDAPAIEVVLKGKGMKGLD